MEVPPENINDLSMINKDVSNVEQESDSSDDNIFRGSVSKQNLINNWDSDSDPEKENENNDLTNSMLIKNNLKKTRIKRFEESDSDSEISPTKESPSLIPQVKSSRIESKRKILHTKFKKLVKSPSKGSIKDLCEEHLPKSDDEKSELSDDEISCLKIKKSIKKMKNTLTSICDAESSDEEVNINDVKKQRSKYKSLKSNDQMQPKLSAKQAMENMQKIKSESNRMLREKDVTLPYHKPKALSLRDIMNRRKPTLTSDGKAMPIKMNNEQLQQYAKLLEERQKEMIDLCKSDSEEEVPAEKEEQINIPVTDYFKEIDHVKEIGNHQSLADTTDKIIKESVNSDHYNETHQISVDVSNEHDSLVNFESKDEIQSDNVKGENATSETSNLILNTDSQAIELHLNSEMDSVNTQDNTNANVNMHQDIEALIIEDEKTNINLRNNEQNELCDDFIDGEDNIELENIDKIIENAEILKDNDNSVDTHTKQLVLVKAQTTAQPKLTGTPGMVIDLETGGEEPKKLTGIELLKERFEYFSKLKSQEDSEKNREKKIKPGTQHLKLKHQLEEEIAEQRSLEWEKRLEEEKKLKSEMEIDSDDDIEKLEAELEDNEKEITDSSSSEVEDEDLVENDIEIIDKPRKSNPMIDDEAEESEEDDNNIKEAGDDNNIDDGASKEDDVENEDDSSDDTSSESEEESVKPKKGRILKAFEDSDDETDVQQEHSQPLIVPLENTKNTPTINTPDDEIQLAQVNRSISEDIFATQETDNTIYGGTEETRHEDTLPCTADLGSQTFSIMNSVSIFKENSSQVSNTQSIDESKFDFIGKKCSESLSQNLLCSPPLMSQSQEIGDDVAAMCTGKFYDNAFVTQTEESDNTKFETEKEDRVVHVITMNEEIEEPKKDEMIKKTTDKTSMLEIANSETTKKEIDDKAKGDDVIDDTKIPEKEDNVRIENKLTHRRPDEDGHLLKSILEELNEPEIETQNKYFVSKEKKNIQMKKRFIIESDDENDTTSTTDTVKLNKLQKRKRQKRALQISDDEEEEDSEQEEEEESEIGDEVEQTVEYDSEENEIEVMPKPAKKKRAGEFFENEAELTSEDEWVGSGDEDEGGLDRMEREEGDSDVFHQGQLQKELGQIHMREVLDQDKREVRLLQELLFEDGDLGDGHRQRKFRWRTGEDGEEAGMGPVDLTDTQEEEFESEELWRKQRHEREVFLRSMQENEEENINTSTNRTTIIKANLNTRPVCSLPGAKVEEASGEAKTHNAKSTKDLPSPKKSFMIFQQNYHGSLLTRGRGALARLAALATPLAEVDGPRGGSAAAGNFVFAALTPDDQKPKVAKRKAEANVGTPRLLKKMKTDDAHKYPRNSLFDHFNT